MKAKDVRRAARLCEALEEIPRLRKAIKEQKTNYDEVWLELLASEISDEEGQGGASWLYLPNDICAPVIDAAEAALLRELKHLGINTGKEENEGR